MVNVRVYGEYFVPSLLICTSDPSNYPQNFTIPSEFKIPNSVTVYAISECCDVKKKKKENRRVSITSSSVSMFDPVVPFHLQQPLELLVCSCGS